MTKVFSVVGTSKSGKTKLLTQLIPLLKEKGYTVCVIKHSHQRLIYADFDHEGKDTFTFSEAGADEVWLTSPQLTYNVKNWETPLTEIIEKSKADFIFVEGFKEAPTKKIVIKKKAEDINVNVKGEVLITIEGEYDLQKVLDILIHS